MPAFGGAGSQNQLAESDRPVTVQVRAVSAPATAVKGPGDPFVVSKPTGTLEGDLMLMHTACVMDEPLDGWTLIPHSEIFAAGSSIALYYRVAGASEPSSYSVPVAANNTCGVSIISLYSDAASGLMIDAIEQQWNSSDSTNRDWPAVTVVAAAALLLCFGVIDGGSASTPAAGFTERYDVGSSRRYLMTKAVSAGDTGTATATGVAEASGCVTLAIAEGTQTLFDGPQYRGTKATAQGANTSSVSVDAPDALVVGDMMILHIVAGASTAITVPGDWTSIATVHGANTYNYAYSKIAEAGDIGATVTVTFSGLLAIGATIMAWFSPKGRTLYIDDVQTLANGSSTTHTFPSVTVTKDVAALAYLGGLSGGFTTTLEAGAKKRYSSGSGPVEIGLSAPVFVAGATATYAITRASAAASYTITVAIAEEAAAAPDRLDASLVSFLQVQAAIQDTFGTPAAMVFGLPVVFEYQDGDQDQIAEWDTGTWTPLEISERVAQVATFTLRGVLFFELMPLFLDAGFNAMTPSGDGPYSYEDAYVPGEVGAPLGYTFRFGGNDGNRAPTSMVQVQDAYLQSLVLTFNPAIRVVTFEAKWFGRYVDDNDGDGYEPASVPLPDGITMVNGLLATLGLQDAGDSGGAFDAIEEMQCALTEWQLSLDTGLRPEWASDRNQLTYCGVRQEWPALTFTATIRTNINTYAVTKVKAAARTFQEMQLTFYDVGNLGDRSLVLRMTGRWLPNFAAHERVRGEIVSKPTFQAETLSEQTTTPHWFSYEIVSGWEHGS